MKLVSTNLKQSRVFKLFSRSKMANGTKDTEDSNSSPDFASDPKKKKRRKRIIIASICIVVLVIAIIGIKSLSPSKNSGAANVTYSSTTAEKRDISVTLSGSGTLEPADSYEVTSLASGEILSAEFEEGDVVEKGDVLYQIDTADAETSIKSAELNLQKSQLSYNNQLTSLENLNVKAPVAGTVTELNVEVGDTVSNNQTIGTIRDSSTMSLMVPFNSADVSSFYIGQSASVTLDSTFETLSGTVTKISNTEQVFTGNMLVKYVTVEVANPGGITDSTEATASIGDIACNSSSSFSYKSKQSITAKTSGTVSSILVDEGNYVKKSAILVKLESSDIEQNVTSAKLSLEDAQNNLENKQEALEDYTIESPIAGTIITKSYKAGDKLSSNSGSSATLCTIYDLSYLTMELSVDELDVSEVEVGQEVSITADAVEGKTYTGIVTKVNISGTTSNGVTAYPVTVRIDETEGLLPGMNVDAEIVLSSVSDVIAVPVDAVVRGNMVLVKKDKSSSGDTTKGQALTLGSNGLPEGFEYVEVTLGVNNDEYIEISSGVEEGDIVAIITINTDTDEATTGGFGGLAGGGGEMPSGGGGGGGGEMPSGGGGGAPMGG
ncbi:MAG: HlyD family efflux transporter periplasmic adaptor subunit [Oscillospiraceae bacterium]|nr:HlyD family efflux transporter periplasmic adaptor subunit [Oscillospiraceae bacterium]